MSQISLPFREKLTIIEERLCNIIAGYQTSTQPIHLFFSYYHDKNPERRYEIDLCLKLNTINPLFTKVFIFNETGQPIDQIDQYDPRIVVVNSKRLTFNKFFKFSNTQTTDETINIVINTDIVVGESFDQIRLLPNQAFCLSRYDFKDNPNETHIAVGGGSHDSWIWKGRMCENLGRFFMGQFLCDGVLAHELSSCGYHLKNPVYDLKIYHIHISNIRNYTDFDRILGHRNGVNFSNNDGIFRSTDPYYEGMNTY